MPERKQKPQIRFKGFSADWEMRRFGDCVLIQRGGSPRPIESYITDDENGINWVKIGDVSVDSRYITKTKEKIISEGEKHSRRVQIGDLILSNSMSFGRPYIMAVEGCIHDGWLLIRDHKNLFDKEYLLQLLSSDYMYSQYKSLASGGVVNNLNSELVQSTISLIPPIEEQQKIGKYFTQLDHLITLHQCKYEKLLTLKKSCLEKMFSKNKKKNPEIRFKGFSAPWKQRKLGEIYQKIRNAFVGTASPYYVECGHFYLESNNVKGGQINRNSEIFINEDFYQKQKDKWLHTDDIVMVQSGHVGHSAVIPPELDNTAAHALIMISNPTEKTDPHFYNYQFQSSTSKNQIDNITTGNTIKHILSSDMKIFEVFISDYSEQVKIGSFFKQLDNLIALHQRKLKMLQNIKKSCLEKMFV